MKLNKTILSLIAAVLVLPGCGSDDGETAKNATPNVNLPIIQGSAIGSATLYSTVPNEFAVEGITRYVKMLPRSNASRSSRYIGDEDAIHIIAADDGVNGEKIRRAVMIMQHLLTDLPSSSYGANKLSIAKTMAQRNATLMLTADENANDALMTRLFVKEAIKQGQLETWVTASGASTLAGLDFTSEQAFLRSFALYSKSQDEDDSEAISNSFTQGVFNSASTPKWLKNSQGLMYRELTVDGDCHYMSKYASYCKYLADNADRDAAYEEILHLVQAQGIAPNNNYQVLQAQIDARALSLYNDHQAGRPAVWQPESDTWQEWAGDDINSSTIGTTYSHEYFAAAFEAYMGLAQHNGVGLDGYQALTRDAMQTQDSEAKGWITQFFHEYVQYTARIDSNGVETFHINQFPASSNPPTFKMNRDDAIRGEEYTYKSQWLLNAKIIGDRSINLTANDQDNILEGNQANNTVDGKAGRDSYVVDANFSECTRAEQTAMGFVVVCPSIGQDLLINVETILFKDRKLAITP